MTSYNPPKKNAAFVMYVALRSQSDTRLFQVNPTLASGDVKVLKDGGAPANVTTLPTVISSSAIVKLELSATEMNADNVTVLFSDAAGGQWCDLVINLQTVAAQFDDLNTTELAIKAKTDNLPADPADDSDIDAQLATIAGYLDTEIAAILAAVDTEVAAIKAKTDNLPADPADDSDIDAQLATITGYLDTEIAAILAAVDTEVAAIKAKTDLIPASPAAVGSEMALSNGAITDAKFSSGGLNAIADEIFKRDWNAITGEAARSLLNAGRFLRNKWYVVGTTLTVMEEDDATVAWTATITKDAASDPVTGSDPS